MNYIYIYIHTPLVLEYDTSSYIYTEYPLLTIIIIARIRYMYKNNNIVYYELVIAMHSHHTLILASTLVEYGLVIIILLASSNILSRVI